MFFIKVQDGFDVAVSRKLMAPCYELPAKLYVVVNLAVGNDRQRAILVVKRLPTAGEVDYAEAPHRQRHIRVREKALAIRSTMTQAVVHCAKSRYLARFDGPMTNDACNATHLR